MSTATQRPAGGFPNKVILGVAANVNHISITRETGSTHITKFRLGGTSNDYVFPCLTNLQNGDVLHGENNWMQEDGARVFCSGVFEVERNGVHVFNITIKNEPSGD